MASASSSDCVREIMIEPIFFPRVQVDSVDIQSIKSSAQETIEKMYHVLDSDPAQSNEVNTRLRDQLVWLHQQMQYFTYSLDVMKLQEDFDWVLKNFDQDLSISEDKRFNNLIKKHLNK